MNTHTIGYAPGENAIEGSNLLTAVQEVLEDELYGGMNCPFLVDIVSRIRMYDDITAWRRGHARINTQVKGVTIE